MRYNASDERWFSLIGVESVRVADGVLQVTGNWTQNFYGTLAAAVKWARETERANSNRIDVAVTEAVTNPGVASVCYHQTRLDKQRTKVKHPTEIWYSDGRHWWA